MPALVLRPLITAVVEYLLAFRVFRKGHFLPTITVLFLVFLATYQFGEFLLFTQSNKAWFAVSLFATTLLPPYGLIMIEKLSHRKSFYLLFFLASAIFGLSFLIFPSLVPEVRECNCFAKIDTGPMSDTGRLFINSWGWYYVLSLTFSMLLMSWHILKKHGDTKNLKLLLLGYFTFFPVSFLLVEVFKMDPGLVGSIMCSLGIITAFIVTHISTSKSKTK